ncbi:hypothetical protein JOF39_001655 [Glutamicibacter protophormiae]|uniref:Uncharacterized protein n=1 Tax=Glutamicibacter protophormiae TaxID=37930 RepID=A0ABS4XPY9_GLUPR|nr:hypothetical protein [Glutamicibacter protophormiae]
MAQPERNKINKFAIIFWLSVIGAAFYACG